MPLLLFLTVRRLQPEGGLVALTLQRAEPATPPSDVRGAEPQAFFAAVAPEDGAAASSEARDAEAEVEEGGRADGSEGDPEVLADAADARETSALFNEADAPSPLSASQGQDGESAIAGSGETAPNAAGDAADSRALTKAAEAGYAEALEGLQAQAKGEAADFVV